MFKVGDKVRRKTFPLEAGGWRFGLQPCIVRGLTGETSIVLEGVTGVWGRQNFELVEDASPWIKTIPPKPARKEIIPSIIFKNGNQEVTVATVTNNNLATIVFDKTHVSYFTADTLKKIGTAFVEIAEVMKENQENDFVILE